MDLTRILTKSADGDFIEDFFSTKDLQDFFTKNMNTDGTLKEEIILFDEAECKVDNSKDFKATDDKPGRIEMIMSDGSLDRSRERMDQAGWKLRNFKRNPVMLFGHMQSIPAIGVMEKVAVRDNKLTGFPRFDTAENDPFAAMIGVKLQTGILRAGSVGFKVIKIEMVESEKDPTRFIIREMELFEFSIVNVPALPTALTRRGPDEKSEGISSEEFDELKDMFEHDYDELKQMIEGNQEKADEAKTSTEMLEADIKELKEELEKKTQELDELKTDVLSAQSNNVDSLFKDIGQKLSGQTDQKSSDPGKSQKLSETGSIFEEDK